MTSIRLFIGGWCEGRDILVKRIAEALRGVQIESQSGHYGRLFLDITLTPHAETGSAKDDREKGTDKSHSHNLVDNELAPFSQVYKDFENSFGHGQTPKDWGLHTVLPNEVESTAPPNEAA